MERESWREFQNSKIADNGKLGFKEREGFQLKNREDNEDTLLEEYIKGYKDLIDEEVFLKFSKEDKQALSDALNQIHWKSLKIRGFQGGKGLPNLLPELKSTNKGYRSSSSGKQWMEVVYTSDNQFEEVKTEALKYKKLLDKETVATLENNNLNILRYTVNRLHQIKKSVNSEDLQGVADGDLEALERALKALLLCPREGPSVQFKDGSKQHRLEKGEEEHLKFLRFNQKWVDPNTKAMIEEGDSEGIRMASNQLHYYNLRNLVRDEYQPETPKKSFAQVVKHNSYEEAYTDKEWTVVKRRGRHRSLEKVNGSITIFVAKIPPDAKTLEIWEFFQVAGKVVDIILPKKRDKFNNRIEFVKLHRGENINKVIDVLRTKQFQGVLLSLNISTKENKPLSKLGNSKFNNKEGEETKVSSPAKVVTQRKGKEVIQSGSLNSSSLGVDLVHSKVSHIRNALI